MKRKNHNHAEDHRKNAGLRARPSRSTHFALVAAALGLVLVCYPHADASIGFYVGKNLTEDGSVFLAGYGDEPSSHWLEIVPRREHKPGTTIKVGVTSRANYPGELIEIPQVATTHKYITMNYSEYAGFPAPLTNGGLNEHHVAGRDIWSPSRRELAEMTPNPQRGPQYSDLSRIAMERATSAREAVEIIGALMDEYGFSTYGGNSHLFADKDEGWIVINFAGGQGLWIAERLGPDDIRVSHPGYILEIPINFHDSPDYMGSKNFISFAVEQGWYDPTSVKAFNVNEVYGGGDLRRELVVRFEERLAGLAPHISLEDMMRIVRTPETTDDRSGYGQVAHLREGVHQELGILWIAATTAVSAPFIPFHLGVRDVPPEYGWHRYLTGGEAAGFMDPAFQGLESTRYAFRTYKRLYYLVMEHPYKFLPEVTEALESFEKGLIARQATIEKTALTLYESGEPGLARDFLTYYSHTEAMRGLDLGEALSHSIEARTKVLYGIREPASAL